MSDLISCIDQEYLKERIVCTTRGLDLDLTRGRAKFTQYGPVFIEMIQEATDSSGYPRYSAYLWVALTNGRTHCARIVIKDYCQEDNVSPKLVHAIQLAMRELFAHGLTTN
jgi:hypothetical protein